jgi:hypothetical protein
MTSGKVQIDTYRNLVFRNDQSRIMLTIPKTAPALNWFAADLGDWLLSDFDRLFWLSNWDTQPPYPALFFEEIRKGHGEMRHIIDAPGHIISVSDESALMKGLMFLTMAFRWQGYLVCQGGDDYVYLGDQCVVCSSQKATKMQDVASIVEKFGLRIISDIREAWD